MNKHTTKLYSTFFCPGTWTTELSGRAKNSITYPTRIAAKIKKLKAYRGWILFF
ncbi:MAG: hypothetical protein ACFFB0_13440 [Promethearchaeota archaeon]